MFGGVTDDLKEVVDSIKHVKDSFSDMFAKLGGMFIDKEEKTEKEPETLVVSEPGVGVDGHALLACKDVHQLCLVLPERGFDFDEEVGVVARVVCNQTKSAGIMRSRDNKVGVFGFDIGAYQAAVEIEPSKQPRIFINLKHAIIKHERESQIHKSLIEKSAFVTFHASLQSSS